MLDSGTAPEGIYYQIDNNNELSVEWILEDLDGDVYQYIATYSAIRPGLMNFYYFTTADGGANATIGIQGTDGGGSE